MKNWKQESSRYHFQAVGRQYYILNYLKNIISDLDAQKKNHLLARVMSYATWLITVFTLRFSEVIRQSFVILLTKQNMQPSPFSFLSDLHFLVSCFGKLEDLLVKDSSNSRFQFRRCFMQVAREIISLLGNVIYLIGCLNFTKPELVFDVGRWENKTNKVSLRMGNI